MNGLILKPGLSSRNLAQAIDEDFRLHFARQNSVGSSAKEIERELLIRSGSDYHDLQLRRLAQQFCYRLDRIRRKRRFKNQDVRRKFRYRRLRLRQGLGLAHHSDIVFESKNLT